MRQKIRDNVFLHLTINLIWNLGLWFLLMYGGSISTAKSQHFWSSSYHIAIISVIITLIGRWTTVEPKSYLPPDNKKHVLQEAAGIVQKFFWSIIDLLNFLFWFLFDSWRRPTVELFARMSTSECTKAMIDACNEEIALENESPITGYFGRFHFSLLKWSPAPFGKVAVVNSTILYGRIYNVQKGFLFEPGTGYQRHSCFLLHYGSAVLQVFFLHFSKCGLALCLNLLLWHLNYLVRSAGCYLLCGLAHSSQEKQKMI